MTAIPALSRLRRASDDEILAERLEPPYTPLRWFGGELSPPTDVYAEVIDTDAQVYTTPIYRTPDPALYRLQPGLIPPDVALTRASLATYHDEAGALQTAAPHVLRDDHWIGGVRTILVEGLRTNLLARSRNFAAAPWGAPNLLTIEPGGVSPIVGQYVVLREQASSDPASKYYLPVPTAIHTTGERVNSIVVGAGTRTRVLVSFRNDGWLGLVFDLASGTVVSTAASHSGKIRPLGDGWWRCEITRDAAAASVTRMMTIATATPGSSGTETTRGHTSDGTGTLLLAQAQGETAPFASSVIDTAGDPITRAADTLTCTLPAGALYERWYDLATGTMTDTLTAHSGGPYAVPVWRAYTHLLVVRSGRTIAEARRIAGVTP